MKRYFNYGQYPTSTYDRPFPERKVLATKYPDDLRNVNKTVYGRHIRTEYSHASSRRPYVLDYWSKEEEGLKTGYEDELRLKNDDYASDAGSVSSFDFAFSDESTLSTDPDLFLAYKSSPESNKEGEEDICSERSSAPPLTNWLNRKQMMEQQ